MIGAMKAAVLVAAAIVFFVLGAPASDAEPVGKRLNVTAASQGERVKLGLGAIVTRGIPFDTAAAAAARRPQISVEPGDRVGVTTVPRAKRVAMRLVDIDGTDIEVVDRAKATPVGESGRRWRADFSRTTGADAVNVDVFYPRDRRPRFQGERVVLGVFYAYVRGGSA